MPAPAPSPIEPAPAGAPPAPPAPPAPSAPPALPRAIGFWGAVAIMVGIVIGSGIFATPPAIARQTGSPLLVLGLWAAGGVISLFGALTFAELAILHPQSGGVYVFLREGMGRAVAFVFGWTYMLISKPFAAAGIAIVFAQHLNELVLGPARADPTAAKVTTSAVLVLLTVLNVRGLRLGSGVAGILTGLKVAALLGIVLLALLLRKGSGANLQPVESPRAWWLALAPIMYGVLWTYDGWSDVGSIAGEVRRPQRTLPLAYIAGTVFLVGLYVAVNAVYLWLVPLEEMRTRESIAPLVMERLVGGAGAGAVALIVIVSTLGSTHGSVITGARITWAQARDGLLFRWLGRIHPRHGTPSAALWFQCLLACGAVWYEGSFAGLAGAFLFTMWVFYGLAGAVIFIERRRLPDRPRPYRCWGYPVVPALFVAASAGMTALAIVEAPRTTCLWLAVLAAGFPVYLAWRRWFPEAGPTLPAESGPPAASPKGLSPPDS